MTSRLVAPLALSLLVSCMEMNNKDGYYAADTGRYGGAAGDSGGGGPAPEDSGDGYEPEEEDDFLALRPTATDSYVFVVNRSRNTVSRVSVPGLEVVTVEVGVAPAVALSTPDNSRAVVFNEGSDDVSIIDAASLAITTVDVRPNFNQMVMSPDGVWVVCYRDQSVESDDPATGGAQSFNEISLVNTVTGEHFLRIVGYNPRQIRFTDDGSLGLVVTDEYLAVLDLFASDPSVSMIQVADDLLDPPPAEEVAISPNGDYAFLRQFGQDDIAVIDLALSELVTRVPVGLNPTDLDITPDGAQAVVVSRGSNELHVLDASDPFATPEVLSLPETELIGSIRFSPDNSRAILYTTAADVAHYTTWDRDTGAFTTRRLKKPVAGVALSPDGGTMLVFHDAERDAADTPDTSPFYGQDALTLISLRDFRENALLLSAEPIAYANATDGSHGYFIMDEQPYLEVLDYSELSHEEVTLRSTAVHVGVLPGTTYAFVNQEHELGRLSFYDPSTGVLETITGFELNAGIEH